MGKEAQDEVSTTDVDTSVNDTQETELEDIEVTLDDDEEETEENDQEDTSANESTEESETDDQQDEESKGKDTDPEEERRRHNAEMAQKRIAEREAREAAKREAQDAYLQQAEDARDMALRQLQVDAYNNKVSTNNTKLELGIDKAVASIDLFQNGSAEVREELARSLDDFERMYVSRDQNGDPVDVRGDVYQFLQDRAESIRRLTGAGARKQELAKNKVKSRTDVLPTRTPKEKKDSDLEDFDKAWGD